MMCAHTSSEVTTIALFMCTKHTLLCVGQAGLGLHTQCWRFGTSCAEQTGSCSHPNHTTRSQTRGTLGSGKEVPAAHWGLLCQQWRCTPKARVQTGIIVETSSVTSLHFDGLVNKEFAASKAVSKIVLNFSFADIFDAKTKHIFAQFCFLQESLGLFWLLNFVFYAPFPTDHWVSNSFFVIFGFQSCIIHKLLFWIPKDGKTSSCIQIHTYIIRTSTGDERHWQLSQANINYAHKEKAPWLGIIISNKNTDFESWIILSLLGAINHSCH